MKSLIGLLIIFASVSVYAQDERPSLKSWRGMTLDETSVGEALERFSAPKANKENQGFRPIKYNEWFEIKNNKSFHLLHYENIEGFKDVKLYFLNDRLVAIHLEPSKLKASILEQTYGVEFEPIFTGISKGASPRDFDRNNGNATARRFPSIYYLMHKAEKSFAFAMVSNGSFGAILGQAMGNEDDNNSYPGQIGILQLISSSLQTRSGVDLLK